MSRLILDTSAYSAFMRNHSGIKLKLQEADEICMTPVVLGELQAGFLKGVRHKKNQEGLGLFLSSPRVKILDMNEETAERYAVILNFLWENGNPIPTNDIWIAASAMQHGLKILTTDIHFKHITQVITDCFSPE